MYLGPGKVEKDAINKRNEIMEGSIFGNKSKASKDIENLKLKAHLLPPQIRKLL